LSSLGILSGAPVASKPGTHVVRPNQPSAPTAARPLMAPSVGSDLTKFAVFESSVDPIMRFCIDKDVHGACWLQLPAKSFRLRGSSPSEIRWSTCQLEAECAMTDLMSLAPEVAAAKLEHAPAATSLPAAGAPPLVADNTRWAGTGRLVVASFDIECVSESGGFPRPTNASDFIIQIATSVMISGECDAPQQEAKSCPFCAVCPGCARPLHTNQHDYAPVAPPPSVATMASHVCRCFAHHGDKTEVNSASALSVRAPFAADAGRVIYRQLLTWRPCTCLRVSASVCVAQLFFTHDPALWIAFCRVDRRSHSWRPRHCLRKRNGSVTHMAAVSQSGRPRHS
jgi:hypothetical protein